MHRRSCLATSAAALAASRSARAAQLVLRMVPQASLTSIDVICTTAVITRNHGFMVYDTLYGPATRQRRRCVVRLAGDPATGNAARKVVRRSGPGRPQGDLRRHQRVTLDERAVKRLGSYSAFTANRADLKDRAIGFAVLWNLRRT